MINLPNGIFSLVMGFLMSFSITLVTTFVRVGPIESFLSEWLEAWSVAYPIAIICILIYKPFASNLTEKLLRR